MVSILQRFLQQGFPFRTPRLLATDLYGQVQLVYTEDYVYVLTQTGLLVQHGLAICEHGIGTGVGGNSL